MPFFLGKYKRETKSLASFFLFFFLAICYYNLGYNLLGFFWKIGDRTYPKAIKNSLIWKNNNPQLASFRPKNKHWQKHLENWRSSLEIFSQIWHNLEIKWNHPSIFLATQWKPSTGIWRLFSFFSQLLATDNLQNDFFPIFKILISPIIKTLGHHHHPPR